MALQSVAIVPHAVCKCSTMVPLNSLVDHAHCGSCRAALSVPASAWTEVLCSNVEQALSGPPQGVNAMAAPHGQLTMWLQAARREPMCAKCNAVLPINDVMHAPARGKSAVQCFACGHPASVRPAPPSVAEAIPGAKVMVGETEAGPQAVAWYIVCDTGDAVARLPDSCDEWCGFTFDMAGNMVVAYIADGPGKKRDRCRVGAIDRRGLFVWHRSDIAFGDDSQIKTSPADGSLLVVDTKNNRIHRLNGQNGQLLATVEGIPVAQLASLDDDARLPEPQPINVYELEMTKRFAADLDGSIVLHTDFHDGKNFSLRRFAATGAPMPVWPAAPINKPAEKKSGGFFSKLFGGGGAAQPEPSMFVEYENLRDKPEKLPNGSNHIAIGWDGVFYVVGDNKLARFTRDGAYLGLTALPAFIDTIRSLGTDKAGNLFILFDHKQEVDGSEMNVLRFPTQGPPEIWLGPLAPPGGAYLSPYERQMAVGPDGTLFIGGGIESIRVVTPDRQLAWRSARTAKEDAERIERS